MTLRDPLGHRCLSSTQICLHTTTEDLRSAAPRHPVEHLINRITDMPPGGRSPLQWQPGERGVRTG